MSIPTAARSRVAAALAVLALLVVGTAQIASAGPSTGSGAQGETRVLEQPPLSADSAKHANVTSGEVSAQAFRQTVSAVVNSNGTLAAGQSFGATAASRIGVGTYEVFFNQVITAGTYVATIGIAGNVGASTPGEVTVVGRVTANNGLFIQTYNSAGTLTDLGFHTVVMF
ncbi:hypothetical protein JOF41_005135 [Saccharothrix coeruleofusca]|uniref:hypothetical protein n=1 Tax=Saccharothrix coeruleofusca TaxID=33919 RepID=UPI001AE1224A|nr:hypothetical protein [Saccharothrix coeruleofusca]MBP2338957.1 hypothetical protein [Saccharothrix coeruleofusca]